MKDVRNKGNVGDLNEALNLHLRGVSSVPALSFMTPQMTMHDCNLGEYEVIPCEPLHDVKGYIKHLWDELPSRISSDENNILASALDAAFQSKV